MTYIHGFYKKYVVQSILPEDCHDSFVLKKNWI